MSAERISDLFGSGNDTGIFLRHLPDADKADWAPHLLMGLTI
jgi:hypothetical protein